MNPRDNKNSVESLAKRLLDGDPLAAARSISLIEGETEAARSLLEAVHGHGHSAYRIGITGPPGAGKSTLVNGLAGALRAQGRTVGILAIDPTSPFSGGALLGDRVRMRNASADAGVFIRSMATRGSSGGLARDAADACDVLDALGRDDILIETVGVGQLEMDIVAAADTTIVVLHPESGDTVQMMKAGLMEIGDVFAINKADRPGADRLAEHLLSGLDLKDELHPRPWKPPVVLTEALHGKGIDELLDNLTKHREHLEQKGLLPAKRRQRLQSKTEQLVEARLRDRVWGSNGTTQLAQLVEQIEQGVESPYSAAEKIIARALGDG